MGLIKSFKCIILYMGSLLSWDVHFLFFLTGAGSSLLLMLMEITRSCWQQGHRKLHKSFYPQVKLEMALSRIIKCIYQTVPWSKEDLAVHWREHCAEEARGDLG